MHRVVPIAAVAVFLSFLAAGSAHAQQGTGELRGRVVDVQNAVLPGVNVVARTSPDLGPNRKTTLTGRSWARSIR